MAARNPLAARRGRRDPLPKHFDSLEEAAEFWDTHDSSEYEDCMREIKVDVAIQRRRDPGSNRDPSTQARV